MKSPIDLKRYFYTKVFVEATPATDENAALFEEGVAFRTKYTLNVKQHREKPRNWMVQLDIKPESLNDAPLPYQIDLQVVGIFDVDPVVEEQDMGSVVYNQGGGLLYSAAREYLLTLTGRGPWSPFALNMATFAPFAGDTKTPKPQSKDKSSTPKKKRTAKGKK